MRTAARPGCCGADDVALMRVDHATGELELLSDHADHGRRSRWPLDDFPATRHVLDDRTPGQVVAGDAAGDPAELAALELDGHRRGADRPGRRRRPRHRAARGLPRACRRRSPPAEVDHARVVAQQFGAALDRLGVGR